MSLRADLLEAREGILAIAARHGACRVFGSAVRAEETTASDLDHIALAQDPKNLLGREVDVVTEGGLHWYIRDRVCRETVPL